MDLGLDGRVFVIGGGSRGLGRATAAALVAEGANVVLVSRDGAKLAEAREALGDRQAETFAADLTDPTTASRSVRRARERFGRLDGALVNTGGPPPATADQLTEDAWRQAADATLIAPARLARVVADDLREHGGGAIAFVLSTSVRSPLPTLALSNAIRPGLAMHVKDLADAYGPSGVRVVGLLPSRIRSDRSGEPDPAVLQRIPLRRAGEPAEFGGVAAFLLSPAASYVTGSVVAVDGGLSRAV